MDSPVLSSPPPIANAEESGDRTDSHELAGAGGNPHLATQIVTNLPYGAQRRVELARALATEPKVLFLDEPTAGMNPEELLQMMEIIRRVHRELGLAIFLHRTSHAGRHGLVPGNPDPGLRRSDRRRTAGGDPQ